MGVNGLWTVVQPCARPTNLATLNRKRLAVDASIWIYQFLKAVRDKEGNALRNSHVVGFFRRICKLLWFGIRPVFVFDGGAPALKRQTIITRKRRREGRREDAVRTAGKLLAVHMQRIAEEESEKRRHRMQLQEEEEDRPQAEEPEDALDPSQFVYVDELGMSQQERQKSRKFHKQDAYHLPELDGSIEAMGRPDDPRIMSIEELEEYARQFNSGEDINLYDFSKIDFEGEFFKSLPPPDRYNILNAARLRSRLRMGLSKEQLDGMFPDRMAFSRFQIERVRERNHLTQRLMQEVGMTGTDLTLPVNARIAGEKDREYILVKNEGAEGGWALGVVSREKDRGEIHKPIDVDAIDIQYQTKEEELWEDDDDFEDVPIEGLNRLPKVHGQLVVSNNRDKDDASALEDDESLFVAGDTVDNELVAERPIFQSRDKDDDLFNDEEEDLNRAIAMSLKTQHGLHSPDQETEEEFEDVPAPEWKQKAVSEQPKAVTTTSGSMIAHIVNNRANAAVSKRRGSNSSSDSELDLRAALSAKKKKKTMPPSSRPQAAPVASNVANPFDGPLPFEKLDWKSSIFANKEKKVPEVKAPEDDVNMEPELDEELAGGFLRDDAKNEGPRPLPPWMIQDEIDIRDSMKAQREREAEINEEDREAALLEEKQRRKDEIIEIESSDSGHESDVEFVEVPPQQRETLSTRITSISPKIPLNPPLSSSISTQTTPAKANDSLVTNLREEATPSAHANESIAKPNPRESIASSPEPEFEEVEVIQPPDDSSTTRPVPAEGVPEPTMEDGPQVTQQSELLEPIPEGPGDDIFGNDVLDDGFSDSDDDELLAQMAEEVEEHARFASQLNNKSERENQESYERELKALRAQQKKDRRDADEVTQIMITECQALLRYFGIPYITAPMEAEAQCAELVNLGLVDGIVTDDSDIFLFGGTRVYKNMFNGNKFVECYLSSDLEKELSLSREQLISLAQLLGSDYTEGLPGVGPVTAVEILSEFPGKDGLTEFRDWWQDVQVHNRPKEADQGSKFRKKFRKAQATKLFLPPGFPSPAVVEAYLLPDVDSNPERFQWGVPDVEGLRQFLMATIGWSQERTDEVLVPVVRDMNRREAEGTQSNITRYFEGGVGVGVKEAFAPRQRTQGSKRMAEAVNRLKVNAAGGLENSSQGSTSAEVLAAEPENVAPPPEIRRKRKARSTLALDDDVDDTTAADEEVVDGSVVEKAGSQRGKGKGRGSKGKKRAKAS
ncbi:hypothetical protein F5X96DRAFT_677652 [Biscogniauxia mediterranea]|nr:hypothetical protein F5X96DRAFT_677652 [Biscogniauxia mediterranea]